MPEPSWDRPSLVAGLLFVAIGTLFLLDTLDVLQVRGVVVFPLLLIGLGVAMLLGGLRGRRDEAP